MDWSSHLSRRGTDPVFLKITGLSFGPWRCARRFLPLWVALHSHVTLENEHTVAVGEEAVAFGNCLTIRFHDEVFPRHC